MSKYDDLPAHTVWQMVYQGDLKRFPNGYFLSSMAYDRARDIIQYIVEEYKKWNREQVLANFNMKTIKEFKLNGMINSLKLSIFELLNIAYPDMYKPWELKMAPQGYWNQDTIIEATKWLIVEKLGWNKKDIAEKLTKNTFIENGLGGLISDELICGSVYKCLQLAFGQDFIEPWELKCTPMSYWNLETAKLPVYYLIDELGLAKEDLLFLNEEIIKDLGFYSAYTNIFNENLVEMLNNAFPGEYKKVGSTLYHLPTMKKRETIYKNNKSGKAGIRYSEKKKKWIASSWENNHYKYLGIFNNKNDAIKCRLDYEIELLKKDNV